MSTVAAWVYRMGGVTVCTEHYQRSAVALDRWLEQIPPDQRIDLVDKWLAAASSTAAGVARTLGSSGSTRINHVPAWHEAFRSYRRIHNI